MKNPILSLVFTLTFLFFSGIAFGQEQGTVRGKINDATTGDPLMFATVAVVELSTGTDTDLDGAYELKLDPGTYTLEISYVGYTPNKITDVVVKAGEVTVLDYIMKEDVEVLGEVIVTAKVIERSENALLLLQKKSITIQDAISAEAMSKFAASTAADAIKRTPGTSVVGGKYVIVRGLGDRYSNASLNGLSLPSTDPYKNSTQLDLIPANLLDNIISSKSFLPDQPGNFTGGSVNIKTKSFPEEFTLQASFSTSYNPQVSLNDNFLTFGGGDLDWLGYDDGNRALDGILTDPNTLSTLKSSAHISGRTDDEIAGIIDRSSKAFNTNFGPIQSRNFMDHSMSFSVGNQFNVANNPLGVLFGVNYSKGFSFFDDGSDKLWEVGGSTAQELSIFRDLQIARGQENPVLGGLATVSYKIGKGNKISAIALYNHDTNKESFTLSGFYPGILSETNATFQSSVVRFTERELQSYQLLGEHNLNEKGVKVEWGGSITNVSQTEPDSRLLANQTFENNGEFDYEFNRAEFPQPYHNWRFLDDVQYLGKVDLTIPLGNSDNKLKFGAMYNTKDREFSDFTYTLNDRSSDAPDYNGDPNTFFLPENMGIIGENNGRNVFGLYWQDEEIFSTTASYTGTEAVAAAYGMGIFDITENLKAIAGVRVEQTNIDVASMDTTKQSGKIDTLDFLPSLNLIYKLNDNMNLRATFTQTLARPNMREMAPFLAEDYIGGFKVQGNPELDRTLVQNYDLRWEWFPNPGELLAASVFYKNFNNPIIMEFPPFVANNDIQIYSNVEEAVVYGVEFEFRKNLGFITPALDKFQFATNFAFIQSNVDMTEDECQSVLDNNPDKGCSRPFYGQSPYLVNANMQYNDDENGWNATASFNIFGERLIVQGPATIPDIYEQPFPQLDLTINKRLTENFSLKLAALNILNADVNQTMEFRGTLYDVLRYQRGSSFSVGISYRL